MTTLRRFLCLVAALAGIVATPVAAAPAQRIENRATLTFTQGGAEREISSNVTRLDLGATISPTQLDFYVLPSSYDLSATRCTAGPPQRISGAPISAGDYAGMRMDDDFGSPSFAAVLHNPAGNIDPAMRETITIAVSVSTGDDDFLELTETAPNSGIFAAAFASDQAASADNDCALTIPRGASVRIFFAGDASAAPSDDTILIDPYGRVFDSATGVAVNGVTITLIDDATGQPARVFGDDGISAYPSTVISGEDVVDAGGYRYDYGPGEYRFPLTSPGNYHLLFLTPGDYLAPSKAEIATLARGPDRSYVISPGSYGHSFALTSPLPLRIDIPVDRVPAGSLLLEKSASVREASPGDFIQYRLRATNRQFRPTEAGIIVDTLPAGLRYKSGSTRGAPEPDISSDGRILRFTLPRLLAGQAHDLSYIIEVIPSSPVGEVVNHASAELPGGSPGNDASAAVRIKPLLFSDALTIIGRVTEGPCGDPARARSGVPGIRLLMEDGTYVVTDRDGLYHFEGVRRGRHVVQLDVSSLLAAFTPLRCDADTRSAGSKISRFVESGGGGLARVDFQLRRTGKADAAAPDALPIPIADDATAAGGKTDWLLGVAPGIDWLFPAVGHNPRAPTLRILIKHLPGQRVALAIDGTSADPLAFDGTDLAGGMAVSRWTGVPLHEGDNLLEARVLDPSGAIAATLRRTVHYANTPVHAAFVPELSRLVADGLTRPRIAVRVTDRDGRPVRAGTIAAFRIDQPYVAAQQADLEMSRQLAGIERADPTVRVVGDDGIAFLALQPTTQAGAARIVFNLSQDGIVRTSELRPWLAAGTQDWVVVGFGAGTIGYDTLSSRAERLAGGRHDVVTDGQLSFYAKGRVKGAWLLTIAYDSDRKPDVDRGLLSVIDPDRYYTVYGDGSAQAYDASTSRKLYLRLERREFFALFGDYETGLTDTRLARFSRTLNGAKAGYRGKAVGAAGFAAHSDQRFARDEIQGNGLSGPYRLSAGPIIPNSDKVTIETRDRFRSEKIVESRLLTRHIDYDIDPDAGTLRFREPILTRDPTLNPNFIVVDYELDGTGDRRLITGGRAAVKLAGDRIELGATYLRDESQGRGALAGVDLKARLTKTTELRAELASGGRRGLGGERALLVEAEHHGAKADLLAYVRQQDEGFGLGQQNIGEAGTRKYGADGRLKLGDKLGLTGSAWRQEALLGSATRTVGDLKLEYRGVDGLLYAELEGASDRVGGTRTDSRLLSFGANHSLLDRKLTVSGETQFALGGDDASVDFPVRHQIALSYKLTDGVRVVASHEIADGAKFKAHSTRLGFDLTPWAGAKLATTLNQQAIGENGARSFAEFGLSQSLPIGKRWTIDATLDASSTVHGAIPVGSVVNPFHPVASGGFLGQDQVNGDYRSATLGATYRAALWSWNGRIELRRADASDRWGVTSNLVRTLGAGKTLASGVRAYRVRQRGGAVTSFASADVALALRPLDSRWSLLERLEFRHERADAGVARANALGVPAIRGVDQLTTRLINNLAINYRTGEEGEGHSLEASLYYGSKYVRGRFDDDRYDGYIDVIGIELRRDLGRRFDLGLAASMQHAWRSGTRSFSVGPSFGISPADQLWLSIGYNVTGFRDPDFEAARYTRQGPYATVRLKLDQIGLGSAADGLRGMFR